MPLYDLYRAVHSYTRDQRNSLKANDQSLGWRLIEVFARTWDLGLTCFGGPPVHFQIFHQRFVKQSGDDGEREKEGKYAWIDEQTVSCEYPLLPWSDARYLYEREGKAIAIPSLVSY